MMYVTRQNLLFYNQIRFTQDEEGENGADYCWEFEIVYNNARHSWHYIVLLQAKTFKLDKLNNVVADFKYSYVVKFWLDSSAFSDSICSSNSGKYQMDLLAETYKTWRKTYENKKDTIVVAGYVCFV
jgi:hypothetical protein